MLFGEFLIMKSAITRDQLEEGLICQADCGKGLGECLVALGHMNREDLNRFLEEHLLSCADLIVESEMPRVYAKEILS